MEAITKRYEVRFLPSISMDGPWWFSMASPVNVITRLGTSVCNPNRLIDRSGKLYHFLGSVKCATEKPVRSPWKTLLGLWSTLGNSFPKTGWKELVLLKLQKMICWLVVDLPLWKIWKSMGRIIPYIMENKNGWNHQPVGGLNRQCSIQLGIVSFSSG